MHTVYTFLMIFQWVFIKNLLFCVFMVQFMQNKKPY